ncbi:MAG: ABC transporter ATP-binding protein [Planctomycetes bacterium]|nr:ABC transporter ATP-binding protein [Planctomycetota bacterium]
MLRLDHVTFARGATPVLTDLSLEVGEGEFVVLLGPSGSGKTSLLRLVAGLERPGAGEIRLGDERVSSPTVHVPPERRGIGMVFQDLALWPHLSVRGHLEFVLRARGLGARERRRRADELAAEVGLVGLEPRRPEELSGGERQRLAVARALAGEPRRLLLDEPLSALEPELRSSLGAWLKQLHVARRCTTLFVTHLVEEGMTLADRVAVLRAGRLVQVGSPDEVCTRPRTVAVARMAGYANVLPVRAVANGVARTALGDVRLDPAPAGARTTSGEYLRAFGSLRVALRADGLEGQPAPGEAAGACRVLDRVWSADRLLYLAQVEGVPLVFRSSSPLALGDAARLSVVGPAVLVEEDP